MRVFAAVFFVFFLFQCQSFGFSTESVWLIADGGNGHAYRVVGPADIEWAEARIQAEKLGGYLVTITSQEENEFVFDLIDEPEYWSSFSGRNSGPWIGAFQLEGADEPDGGWTWLNDEGLLSETFDNWTTGEPNDFGSGNENTVNFWSLNPSTRTPTWNDTTISTPVLAYVVEFDTPILLGDINNDGMVNLLDVSGFVELITNSEFRPEADFDCDGSLTLLDVSGFVEALMGG